MSDASASSAVQRVDERAIGTYRLRPRDRHLVGLRRGARAANAIWNYGNQAHQKAVKVRCKWLGRGDLAKRAAGSGPLLGVHAHRVQRVCREYTKFTTGHVVFDGASFVVRGACYVTMYLRDMPAGMIIQVGNFNAAGSGRWYFWRMASCKAMTHAGSALEVCERHTSQSCSECGSRPVAGPRGISGSRTRIFACDDCGLVLERDVNTARNILLIGQDVFAGGSHV